MGTKTVIAIAVIGLITATGASVALSSGVTNGCVDVEIDAATVRTLDPIAGYSSDELVNAASIINAGQREGYYAEGQTVAVMVAIAQSGLRNVANGSRVGLFQMDGEWGTVAERTDPRQAAGLFYDRFGSIPNLENTGKSPAEIGAAVIGSSNPKKFAAHYTDAVEVVSSLTTLAGGGACAVSGDPVALATELTTAADRGQLRGLSPDHIKEIRWIAQGKVVEGCGIDVRILQVMVIALHTFETVGVSDINRQCTGQLLGAGTGSSHWVNGGGQAVDFYMLGDLALTGADGQSVRLIGLLDPVMPSGARVGQSICRALEGTSVALTNMVEYPDRCNHLHIDVAYTPDRLRVG